MDEIRRSHFIYCVQRLSDGDYIFLNRNYKPLGFHTYDWIDYEDPMLRVSLRGLTAKKAAKISWRGDEDLATIFLYNDGCIPTRSAAHMKTYFARLEILMKLSHKRDKHRSPGEGLYPKAPVRLALVETT